MLVLRRKEGQWVEIRHKSGDVLRVRTFNIRTRYPGQLDLAFDDEDRNFQVQRPEREAKWEAKCPDQTKPETETASACSPC